MDIVRHFTELRRRRVFRTAAFYVLAAWVLLQAADLAFPGFGIPDRAIRYVWFAAIAGFPLALFFGWRYDITPRGLRRTRPRRGAPADRSLERGDYLTLAALAVVGSIVAWQALGRILQDALPPATAATTVHPHSIAVLPLHNLTGDADAEYLVDGIHDAIIADLAKISALRVISRTSTNVYRAALLPLPEVGRQLRVAYVLEGSVFRTDDRVRLTVQLIDAATDEHVWAMTYERELRDLLVLPRELARAVAQQVRVSLTPDEERRLTDVRQVDPDVYTTYLKGMHHLKQLTPDGTRRGLELLHDAIAQDPREPLAYAGLALGYNTIGHGTDSHGAFPRAIAAARRALEIDDLSGEAWAALAEAQVYYEWDWTAAERSFTRALQLSPGLDHAWAHYAYLLTLYGRMDEALAAAETARRLSPLDPIWAGFAAWLYMTEERWDEGFAAIDECLGYAPQFPLCIYTAGQLHAARGELDDAVAAGELLPAGSPFSNWVLGPAYGMAGRHDDARRIAAGMATQPHPKDILHIAFTYAGMGETDEAFRWFGRAVEERVDWLPWIGRRNAYGGVLEPLRSDPRFHALLRDLALPEDGR